MHARDMYNATFATRHKIEILLCDNANPFFSPQNLPSINRLVEDEMSFVGENQVTTRVAYVGLGRKYRHFAASLAKQERDLVLGG
jgi:hypothetical protein